MNKKKSIYHAAILAGASMMVMSAQSVQAQQSNIQPSNPATGDVATDSDSTTADIVVTANRRAQSLQDVPMSINVATGEQLQRLKILDVKDVQQLAPGLELSNNGGRNNIAALRGIDFNPDSGTTAAVDVYFNEIAIDAQTVFTAIYDVDQIEVLRGPQGGLRGRTSPAGAITIRTRRPDIDKIDGYVQATGTEKSAYNVQGGVSLPLVPGKLAIRAAMLVDGNQTNQVRNITRDETSRSHTLSGRASLAWQPTDNLDINLMYQYLYADNRPQQQVFGPGNAAVGNPPIASKSRLAVAEGRPRFENESHLVTLDANWRFGAVNLNVVAGHQYSVLNQTYDEDAGNAVHGYQQTNVNKIPYKVDTAEVRLLSDNEGFWNWTISGYYSRQIQPTEILSPNTAFSVFGVSGNPLPLAIGSVATNLFIPIDQTTKAIAASSRFKFSDKMTLEVAARYTDIKRVSDTLLPDFGNISIQDIKLIRGKPLTGAATLTYKFNPDLTAYASYARSYRAPSAGVALPGNISPDLAITKPERSDAYEVGVKTAFLDRRLTLDVSAFYQKFDGFISRFQPIAIDKGVPGDFGQFTGPPDGQVDDASPALGFNYNGRATVKGIEATLAGHPTTYWDFSISGSYIKARYDNALLPCTTLDAAGNPVVIPNPAFGGVNNVSFCTRNSRLSDSPDFNLTANTEVRFEAGDLQPFVRALFTYRPSVFSVEKDFQYQDRELLNLFVGVRGVTSKWELTAFVRNLLNQNRITNITAANATVVGGSVVAGGANPVYNSGYRAVNVTNPREFGISASYHF